MVEKKDFPLVTVNTPPTSGDRTYVVIGVPRGGTSMVSGAMTQLGIDMGGGNNKRWEDDILNLVMLKRNGHGLPDLVRRLETRLLQDTVTDMTGVRPSAPKA